MFESSSGAAVPITKSEQSEERPHWSNDGQSIFFTRWAEEFPRVFAKSANLAAAEQFLMDGVGEDFSESGKYALVRAGTNQGPLRFRYVLMTEEPRKAVAFPDAFQKVLRPKLSFDDRLLAYESRESGQTEVFVVDFPAFGNKSMVSRRGGHHSLWQAKRAELFFLSGDNHSMMSAKAKPDGRGMEEPAKLFDLPESVFPGQAYVYPYFYDVASDGERFLMLQRLPEDSSRARKPNVRVVLNWFEEFREKK